MWRALLKGWCPPEFITKEEYTKVKSHMSLFSNAFVGITGFCATYNGGWMRRYGAIAKTKDGKTRNYYEESIRNIQKQIKNLQLVSFISGDYKDLEFPTEPSFIYCDPPYQTSHYIMYNEQNFNYTDYWNWVREKSKTNYIICSEYNAPDDFNCIWSKELTTTFDKNSRSQATEKLFTYKNGLYSVYINL